MSRGPNIIHGVVVYSDYKVRLGYTLGKGGSNGKARQKNNIRGVGYIEHLGWGKT